MECSNPECFCSDQVGVVRDGDEFCGERCAAAVNRDDEEGCDCGHAGCALRDEALEAGVL